MTDESKVTAEKGQNRLAQSSSPYLRQHASNPVDWYPWGDEAFDKARKENKPIFLSVGYSTCHWCHVMAHESFEDPEVARLMNDLFVSIKVDREERPDIDGIYMTVCHMLTGRGGWPLTIIMTPDKKPFFAATYIPRKNRYGQTGMVELIPRVKEIWNTRPDEIASSAEKICAALEQEVSRTAEGDLDENVLHKAYGQLSASFDETHGGFGGAPKFPSPHNLLFLLRYWKRTGERRALDLVERTLDAMGRGGIYDHLGFGFHRYATDAAWLVPHFEKMLYDQAMMTLVYGEAYRATGDSRYERKAAEVFSYVFNDLTAPEGGFFCAEDADSDGEEGKFYVWEAGEIEAILGEDDARLFARIFNVTREGNFDEEATGRKTGANILHRRASLESIAESVDLSLDRLNGKIEQARRSLLAARAKRNRPHRDGKILTDWNGLMIAALARGAAAFGEGAYADGARRAAEFVLEKLRTDEGSLRHSYFEGRARFDATVDDYAFFIFGLIALYEATHEARWVEIALELQKEMDEKFWDDGAGGFFFTESGAGDMIVRRKEIDDSAYPSGNSVAMSNLLWLARFTGDGRLEEMAARTGAAFGGKISQWPHIYTHLLTALDSATQPSREVVVVGERGAPDTAALLGALAESYFPNLVVVFKPTEDCAESETVRRVAPHVKDHVAVDRKATAYVCAGFVCAEPTTDRDRMLEILRRP